MGKSYPFGHELTVKFVLTIPHRPTWIAVVVMEPLGLPIPSHVS
jgi:hypothetical protein